MRGFSGWLCSRHAQSSMLIGMRLFASLKHATTPPQGLCPTSCVSEAGTPRARFPGLPCLPRLDMHYELSHRKLRLLPRHDPSCSSRSSYGPPRVCRRISGSFDQSFPYICVPNTLHPIRRQTYHPSYKKSYEQTFRRITWTTPVAHGSIMQPPALACAAQEGTLLDALIRNVAKADSETQRYVCRCEAASVH